MDRETRIERALRDIRDGTISSVRKAADLYEIPRTTLQARMNGAQPHSKAHITFQKLSPIEEDSIERSCKLLYGWGWPMTIAAIEGFAKQLLLAKGITEPLGNHWYQNFLLRHPNLKLSRSRTLDEARKDASHLEVLQGWFTLYTATKFAYGVADEDIYNMDEKGLMKGIGDNSKVIIPRIEGEAFVNQPGNRDWVSIIECIGINGYLLPPFLIFKGQRIQDSWVDETIDPEIVIRVSPNGWTDSKIGFEWLQHFDHHTKNQRRGAYRMLILDGHASHISFEFVEYCEKHKILPICLPSKSTHILQPLDVGVFSALGKAYKVLLTAESVFGAARVDNLNFLKLYTKARMTIPHNIAGAFRGAGLFPFDPERILTKYRPQPPPFEETSPGAQNTIPEPSIDVAKRIEDIIDTLLSVCPTPLRSSVTFVRDTCLTALADKKALVILNEGLVRKQREGRKGAANRRGYGPAKLLNVKEILEKRAEHKEREAEKLSARERRELLKGRAAFVKLVWKELNMEDSIFA
jgi:hypothetical protein